MKVIRDTYSIGIMGSARKVENIFRDLMEKGYNKEDLQRLHCPIGIEIYADSLEEHVLA